MKTARLVALVVAAAALSADADPTISRDWWAGCAGLDLTLENEHRMAGLNQSVRGPPVRLWSLVSQPTPDDEAVRICRRLTRNEHADVRAGALFALMEAGRGEGPDARRALDLLNGDPSDDVRGIAALYLASIREPWVDGLESAVRDRFRAALVGEPPQRRVGLAEAMIWYVKPPRSTAMLRELGAALEAQPELLSVVAQLQEHEDPVVTEVLTNVLERSPHPSMRLRAVESLAWREDVPDERVYRQVRDDAAGAPFGAVLALRTVAGPIPVDVVEAVIAGCAVMPADQSYNALLRGFAVRRFGLPRRFVRAVVEGMLNRRESTGDERERLERILRDA